MWVNANAVACYGLAQYGFKDLALDIAKRVTAALAADLRSGSQWHEAYSTAADGAPLAAGRRLPELEHTGFGADLEP